jgi:hypothetical protein
MANATTTGTEAGRAQPQTSVEPGGGPFIRHAQAGRQPIYLDSTRALGGQLTNPLIARPGYYRDFRVTHQFVTGGTLSGTVAYAADAPYNLSTFIQVKDAFGTPVFTGDGYSISYLVPLFSGGFGLFEGSNFAANLPSWTAVSTSTGAGSFSYSLPFEFAQGYGVIAGANASVVPTLQFNFAGGTTIFGSSSTGNYPTITTTVDSDIYWLPEGVDVEPPGLGTTRQWQVSAGNPTISSASSLRVQATRLGGYLDTIIVVMRDSTNARVDSWPTTPNGRMQVILDGIPYIDSNMNEIYDDMAIQYGIGTAGLATSTRPTGVISLCRKTSLAQRSLGLLDTGEKYLSTNPGSLLEFYGSPWGTISNSPATLQVICGQIVPTGAIIQGLPET